ncbi:MAG: FlgD immunoglobulin-like domain containing protein [Candidatus Cloacimonetes bacterium]|nr:FlgD immunoglobulin-like domain containing protein [Candidatus Cloacimonadota bacterium]
MKRVLMFIIVVMASVSAFALTAGDIAIIGVNTDTTKSFAFVALTSIPANTTISFTDNAWNASTEAWRSGEGTIEWSHTSAVSAGSVIVLTLGTTYSASTGSVTTSSGFNLSASGDQILAYEGNTAPSTNSSSLWLYGFSIESFAWGSNSNTSDIPTALSGASAAMTTSTTEIDNAYFANGTTSQTSVTVSGTKTALLALFNDSDKYYKNNTGPLTFPTYSITVSSGSTPSMTVDPDALTGFTYEYGSSTSTSQSYTLSGANLTGFPANITITGSTNYEVSTDNSSFAASKTVAYSSATLASTTIYVRLKTGLEIGTYNSETISNAGGGATTVNVTCSGSVTSPPAPEETTATAATNVATDGFTANWEAVSGATGYRLDVYTKTTGANATDLFISEYIEGSASNKYIEIFNGTGSSVDLSDYYLRLMPNGQDENGASYINNQLSGTLANGACIVYQNSNAALTLPNGVTATDNTAVNFNGDDTIGLYKDSSSSYVDIFGCIGYDPGSDWGSSPLSAVNTTLVRKSTVTGGVTANPSSSFPTLTTEWDNYAQDTVSYLGSHTMSGGTSSTFVSGYENLNVSNVTTYNVSGLDPGTTYYYVVRAYNTYGTSDSSNEVSRKTEDEPLPVELSSFSAVLNAQNYVNIMWVTQTETSLTGFYIFRSNDNVVANAVQVSALINPTNTSQQQQYLFTDNTLTEAGTYYYWLQIAEMDGSSSFSNSSTIYFDNTINPGTPGIPKVTELNNVYPNPFNPTATISYGLAKAADVNINIYNARGQIVRTFTEGTKAANSYRLVWNGKDNNGRECSTGIYYIKMQAGKDSFTRKAVLMK